MNFIQRWLIVVLSTVLPVACESNVREVSQKRFMQMVKDQEVDRVIIVNDQLVEIVLTPEALASSKYQSLFRDDNQVEKGKSYFQIRIVSEQAFRNDLAKMNPAFPVSTEKRGLFSSTR